MKECLQILLLAIVIAASGCNPVVAINEAVVEDQLSFLKDGVSKKSEIEAVLGQPQILYENGRIIVYLMCPGRNGQLVMFHRSGGCSICCDENIYDDKKTGFLGIKTIKAFAMYNLVLVFDNNGVVEQHNLIRTR